MKYITKGWPYSSGQLSRQYLFLTPPIIYLHRSLVQVREVIPPLAGSFGQEMTPDLQLSDWVQRTFNEKMKDSTPRPFQLCCVSRYLVTSGISVSDRRLYIYIFRRGANHKVQKVSTSNYSKEWGTFKALYKNLPPSAKIIFSKCFYSKWFNFTSCKIILYYIIT